MRKLRKRQLKTPPPDPEVQRENHLARSSSTAATFLARQRVASKLMSTGVPMGQVVEHLMQMDPELLENQAIYTYNTCLKAWRDTFENEIPYHRASQLHRLHTDLVAMRLERKATNLPKGRRRATWSDILKCEMAIARITGTFAAVKLEVNNPNAVLSESLSKILGEMTPDEQDALIAEGEALE